MMTCGIRRSFSPAFFEKFSQQDPARFLGPQYASLGLMNELTRLLDAVKSGDQAAAEELLPLTYRELHRIAARMMANEQEGHTLQPTALIHEAYLRLVGPDGEQPAWDTRGHFFSAAAEAMRRILIDHALFLQLVRQLPQVCLGSVCHVADDGQEHHR